MAATGKAALIGGRSDIGGKTGTTNQAKDVWFAGVHPTNAAVVWVGFDKPKPVAGGAAFGGTVAAPVWRKFMVNYLSGKSEKWIEEDNTKSKVRNQDTESANNTPNEDVAEPQAPKKPKTPEKPNKTEEPNVVDTPIEEGVDALPGDETIEIIEEEPQQDKRDDKTP